VQVVGADFDGQFQHSEGFRRLARLQQAAAELAERPQISRFLTQSPSEQVFASGILLSPHKRDCQSHEAVNVVRILLLPKGVGEECVLRLGESLALPKVGVGGEV
jgi:hypothetical protein